MLDFGLRYVESAQIRSFFRFVFSLFGLNTEIYSVNLRIKSEYRKIRTRKNSVIGHFSSSGKDPNPGYPYRSHYSDDNESNKNLEWVDSVEKKLT